MNKPSLKYCGIHSLADLQVTARSNADYLGFIFAESKRAADPADVKSWREQIDTEEKQLVGVFVNEDVRRIAQIAEDVELDVIQLHGDESAEDIKRLKSMTDCEIWKALHHGSGTVQKMKTIAPYIDGFVIDSSVKGMRGGTGISFSWESVPLYKEAAAREGKRLFIAGGVSPKSIGDLLRWSPPGIDLASGIEEKGQKSEKLMNLLEERMFDHVFISE
ncbi:phosphoribosylanthranilate isomerase [Bacillus swezeyi]|uniref:N-(5'-phosphoribosyl)anthranilate isomerase n=1 Tax=Bacillus swezeyi TaxID=1925020 RepID=A0A1R1QFY4_9BACI|nr:phosphoribosylanthranilate isomerase [Bacillus swezeyi]MEC1260536.1 phosphoribosylanthranilate isomerase [Bacillus swezeyi]MED2929639.1 phosphoribosylanthranilate isomerase [Bacillus swezeyi]MED2963334.1 phosphoribosylanthranilate isomerase [Bacillus swezeyi]MED2979154.1 phosphoribosylanthranilate isomerase [Bacillus swezeyi]MED3073285.1 phosphoribosylanthranilate isomerase [Bacillus swezeyi]